MLHDKDNNSFELCYSCGREYCACCVEEDDFLECEDCLEQICSNCEFDYHDCR